MISLIVAISKNNIIGSNGGLPWNIPQDLKLFRKHTLNSCVIMGKSTFESLPNKKPLKDRVNIIVSTTLSDNLDGFNVFKNIDEAVKFAQSKNENIFIIGGSKIYETALEKGLIDQIFVSKIKKQYEGDVCFPEINWNNWDKLHEEDHDEFVFQIYNCKTPVVT